MKKSLLFFGFILTVICSVAQSSYNLVIFSEDGEPFYAYVNGIRQNDKPETNIRVRELNSEALSVRIQFENKALPVLKQNMMPEFGYEHTINIQRNVKKTMKLQYFGKVSLDQAPRTNAATVQYHTAENPIGTVQPNIIVEEATSVTSTPATGTIASVQTNEAVTEESTTTSVITTTSTHAPKPSKKRKQGGNSAVTTSSIVSTHSVHPQGSVSVTSSTVISSSTTSSIIPRPINPALLGAQTTSSVSANTCSTPINEASYQKMKTSIDNTPFQDSKMSVAKVAVKNNCLSVTQIKGICELFGTDDFKLIYAKYAYDYCSDKANYYQVSEVFSFSRTTQDLNKFLEQK